MRRVWLDRYPRVHCPSGHVLGSIDHSLAASTRCCSMRLPGGARCGACVFVLRPQRMLVAEQPLILVAEITFEEIQQLATLSALSAQLRFLGLNSPAQGAA